MPGSARSRKTGPAPLGPLTVARARALTAPFVKKSVGGKSRTNAAHRHLGVARRRLAAIYNAEIDERIQHYRATYSLLRTHGIAGAPVLAAASSPLRIVAEGDSWFDYPLHARGGIIPRLEDAIGIPILSLAKAGDEMRTMLGVKERERLEDVIGVAASRGLPFDVLLFSGGGNDIVGDPVCLWVKTWDPAKVPAAHLDTVRFDEILGIVKSAYEDLFSMRDHLSPETHIFLHEYDFALPSGKGACSLGPWLKPSLDYREFPGLTEGAALVKEMLLRFKALLIQLANREKVTVIPTQGTLGADKWSNELHPTSSGFDDLTEVFRSQIDVVFPGRIPSPLP